MCGVYVHISLSYTSPCVSGFSVKVSTISPSGYEGDDLNIGVSLDGQIFGAVDIELELLTVSEFEERNIGPLPVAASGKNPAERKWHSWRIGKLLCILHWYNIIIFLNRC